MKTTVNVKSIGRKSSGTACSCLLSSTKNNSRRARHTTTRCLSKIFRSTRSTNSLFNRKFKMRRMKTQRRGETLTQATLCSKLRLMCRSCHRVRWRAWRCLSEAWTETWHWRVCSTTILMKSPRRWSSLKLIPNSKVSWARSWIAPRKMCLTWRTKSSSEWKKKMKHAAGSDQPASKSLHSRFFRIWMRDECPLFKTLYKFQIWQNKFKTFTSQFRVSAPHITKLLR